MKPPVGSFPPPIDPLDAATQTYVNELGYLGDSDFIHAEMSSTQADPSVGAAIDYDTVINARGLSVNASGRFSGLKAGRTYLATAHLYVGRVGGGHLNFQWYDVTNATNIGVGGTAQTTDESSGDSSQPAAIAVIVPEQDIEIECRKTGGLAGVDVQTGPTNAHIVEISSKKVIAGEWIPVETKEVTGSAIENLEFDYDINGNRDEAYKVEYFIKTAVATTRDLRIRVNSLISSTNVAAASMQSGGAHQTFTDLVLSRTLRNYIHGYFVFNAAEKPLGGAVAQPRTFYAKQTLADDPAAGAGTFEQGVAGVWTDSGNLTRLVIQNTQQSLDTGVSEIDVGSIFRLYRKAKPSDYKRSGYAELRLSSSQTTNKAVNNHLEFDSIGSNSGQFSLATGAGQANGLLTVKPGTYEIEFHVRVQGDGADEIKFELRDDPGDTLQVSDAGASLFVLGSSINLNSGWSTQAIAKGFLTLTAETVLKLDIASITGVLTSINASGTYLILKEI